MSRQAVAVGPGPAPSRNSAPHSSIMPERTGTPPCPLCANGAWREMLTAMRRPPADWVALHPAAEWLATCREAAVGLLAYDGVSCSEAAGPLAEAVRQLEANPNDYRLTSPAGREMRVIDVLQRTAEKCALTPRGTVAIRVRDA